MSKLRDLKPVGHRVLVKLKKNSDSDETYVMKNGIITEIRTERKKTAEKMSTQEAWIMALGQNAFKAFDDGSPWCKVGDLALICKYSGEDRSDIEEGEIYRIINDEDIEAIFKGEELK